MKTSFAIAVILGTAFLAAAPIVTSLPPPQVPMNAPELPVQRLFASSIFQGDDVQPLLRSIASGLNQGYPDGWERFTRTPVSSGSSSIEMVTADNLKSAMQNWGLDGGVLDQAYDRVHTAIELAVSEAVYFAQGFSYNWAPCQGGGDHPACLSTLIVVVKVPDAIGDDDAWKAEVGHIYISTVAETLQQWVPWHRCHNCWFKRCCHDGADPRNLETWELEAVKIMMSTFQADWALKHPPGYPAEMSFARTNVSPSRSLAAPSPPLWPGRFDNLLRLFLGNPVENSDVNKTYRGGLLAAVQNATLSHRQGFHNMELSVREQGVVPVVEDMLSSCFSKAGIQESIEKWWRRAYVKDQTDPISLECEFAAQRKVSVIPARTGCAASSNVAVDTSYFWVLIAPREGLFDILFMEGEVSVTFDDCIPIKDDDQEGDGEVRTTYVLFDDQESSGCMVRWANVDPSNGSFRSVQYLAEWAAYPSYFTKVVLDFLRLASASSYLKVPIYDKRPSFLQQYQVPNTTTTASLTSSLSFDVLMVSIGKFADTWSKLANAIGSSSVTTIQRRICLGFDALDYKASTGVMQGVSSKNMASLVEDVVDFEELPRREDIRRLMSGVKYSTNFT
ncbi:hypothetical protein BG015_007447 [Linnemannia schmuckeri]|uniref:Uncharacterized protein n=1 Tax=Linnemannia schmuckeri TaxID=64567 RepID=A0A9P5S0N3_9FUNG|nr:hypothetical protein BG015_007447 [Linnemannia schmuckeri]